MPIKKTPTGWLGWLVAPPPCLALPGTSQERGGTEGQGCCGNREPCWAHASLRIPAAAEEVPQHPPTSSHCPSSEPASSSQGACPLNNTGPCSKPVLFKHARTSLGGRCGTQQRASPGRRHPLGPRSQNQQQEALPSLQEMGTFIFPKPKLLLCFQQK